jgi:hypothetical protein
MPSWLEFRLACRGLFLLARFDPGFLRFFDRSASGALRSFWLAPFLLPSDLLHAWFQVTHPLPSPGLFFSAEILGYFTGWILFPLLLLNFGRILERDPEIPGAIAICNWMALLILVVQLPSLTLTIINPDSGIASLLRLATVAYLVAVEGFLLVQCLRLQLWQAASLVVLDILIGIGLFGMIIVLGRVPIPVGG